MIKIARSLFAPGAGKNETDYRTLLPIARPAGVLPQGEPTCSFLYLWAGDLRIKKNSITSTITYYAGWKVNEPLHDSINCRRLKKSLSFRD